MENPFKTTWGLVVFQKKNFCKKVHDFRLLFATCIFFGEGEEVFKCTYATSTISNITKEKT